nr:1182_t:CDS:2 [Entrophospora candida]
MVRTFIVPINSLKDEYKDKSKYSPRVVKEESVDDLLSVKIKVKLEPAEPVQNFEEEGIVLFEFQGDFDNYGHENPINGLEIDWKLEGQVVKLENPIMVMKKRHNNKLIETSSLSSIIDKLEINSQPGNSIADDNNSQIAYYDMIKIFKKIYLL